MTKVRELSAAARPPERVAPPRTEATDRRLTAALLGAAAQPSPASFRVVAQEYQRLGILDRAHEYLERALQLDPKDAATYEAMARMWRDGGFPDRALGDAYRAVYQAPTSAAIHNTLGTVLQALGRHEDARRSYERALRFDPTAAYALNNICYGWILDREPEKAEAACTEALRLQPTLKSARNNLALALAAKGDLAAARAALHAQSDRATAQYNLGIVHMARRQYTDAVSAFAAAQQARPEWRMPSDRAAQAARLAQAELTTARVER
jgi:Tfp pilus assembly protein PilF